MGDENTRIAKTEALFREVNETIAQTAEKFEADEAEFVCECAEATCTTRVPATLDEYERVRAEPTHFLLARGHEEDRVERVVRERKRYQVVEKFEKTVARIVTKLNPRTA